VSTQTALKLLFELRAVLERVGETDFTLHETVARDIERALGLTDSCITQLTGESPESAGEEEDE
jgi:hypothetical protein